MATRRKKRRRRPRRTRRRRKHRIRRKRRSRYRGGNGVTRKVSRRPARFLQPASKSITPKIGKKVVVDDAIVPRSVEELKGILDRYDINLEARGKGTELLFAEIDSGESSLILRGGKLYRKTRSVWVEIHPVRVVNGKPQVVDKLVLSEIAHHNENTGETKIRGHPGEIYTEGAANRLQMRPTLSGHPLSEKIKSGETPQQAARRGIAEELFPSTPGRPEPKIARLIVDAEPITETVDSFSYPGLKAIYEIWFAKAAVKNLPISSTFLTADTSIPGRTIEWKWNKVT